jgi:hypothetical protein
MQEFVLKQTETEELYAAYFNKDALRLPPYKLHRFGGAFRTYYTFGDEKEGRVVRAVPKMYIGVTSLLSATLPTSPYLVDWLIANGSREESDLIVEERAEYGTMMHKCIEHLLINKEFDLDNIRDFILMTPLEGVRYDIDAWEKWLRQDILAFARFMLDYNIEPLFIEGSLKSDRYRMAGTLDLFCKMDWQQKGQWGEVYKSGPQKGLPKETSETVRINALIDFKSSRKSVHLSHELQLAYYEKMLRENFSEFSDVPIHIFNWRPKDWRKQPDFTLTNQTGKHSDEVLDALNRTFFLMNRIDGRERLYMGGKLDLKEGIERNYSTESIEDLLMRKHGYEPITESDE